MATFAVLSALLAAAYLLTRRPSAAPGAADPLLLGTLPPAAWLGPARGTACDRLREALVHRLGGHLPPPPARGSAPGAPPAAPPKPRLPSVRDRVSRLVLLTPREIDKRLEALGYRGQEEARRATSVLAFRHLRRLQRLHVEGVPAETLPPRDNLLLVGPTGCGKTLLVEQLFREVLEVPTVIVDITGFSETGYVGSDVATILTRLVAAAGGDPAWAACGVACLGEFDKLASSASSARFAGAGTTKDVSGFGVQRSLLSLLSGARAAYPAVAEPGAEPNRLMDLAGLIFIACGAFSGLSPSGGRAGIAGFSGAPPAPRDLDVSADTSAFERYGIIPELMGRFSRVVPFEPLGRADLRSIADGLVATYAADMASDGLTLLVGRTQLENLVERALRRGTGARGLRAEFHREIVEAQYARLEAAQVR